MHSERRQEEINHSWHKLGRNSHVSKLFPHQTNYILERRSKSRLFKVAIKLMSVVSGAVRSA